MKTKRLRNLLYRALVPPGFRPENNEQIEAMLDTISAESLTEERRVRMLRKISGKQPIGVHSEEVIEYSPIEMSEEQKELLALCRAKGKEIPPEIKKILEAMEKRAAGLDESE